MAKRKRTHKADGLYYITPAMLEDKKHPACDMARRVIYKTANIAYQESTSSGPTAWSHDRDTKIPVTIDLADKIIKETDPRGWFLQVSKIPSRVQATYSEALFPDPRRNEEWEQADRRGIRVAMDLLYDRAVRERLVRE